MGRSIRSSDGASDLGSYRVLKTPLGRDAEWLNRPQGQRRQGLASSVTGVDQTGTRRYNRSRRSPSICTSISMSVIKTSQLYEHLRADFSAPVKKQRVEEGVAPLPKPPVRKVELRIARVEIEARPGRGQKDDGSQ